MEQQQQEAVQPAPSSRDSPADAPPASPSAATALAAATAPPAAAATAADRNTSATNLLSPLIGDDWGTPADFGPFTLRTVLRALAVLSGLLVVMVEWLRYGDVEPGAICADYPTDSPRYYGCLSGPAQLTLLSITRFTAGAALAGFVVVFFSKMHNTRIIVQESFIGTLVDFEPTHELHVEFGILVAAASVIHGVGWLVNLNISGQGGFSWQSQTGGAGIAALVLMMVCTLPMAVPPLRKRWSYETRKILHYTFIGVMIALACHSPVLLAFSLLLLLWYLIDTFYLYAFNTHIVRNVEYVPVGFGTSIHFRLPPGYKCVAGQYCYINCPWVSKYQWHAFSIIPEVRPDGTAGGSIYVAAVGKWTRALFAKSLRSHARPMWLSVCYPSTADHTLKYDKLFLVASGAGLTPMISLINRYADTKEVYLLWMTRDRHMVQHFRGVLERCHSMVCFTEKGVDADTHFATLQNALSHESAYRQAPRASVASSAAARAWEGDTAEADSPEEPTYQVVLRRGRPKLRKEIAAIVAGHRAEADMETNALLADGSGHAAAIASAAAPPSPGGQAVNDFEGMAPASSEHSTAPADKQQEAGSSERKRGGVGREGKVAKAEHGRTAVHAAADASESEAEAVPLSEVPATTPANADNAGGNLRELLETQAEEHKNEVVGHVLSGEENRWSLVYCGASAAVGQQLRDIARNEGMTFNFEAFGDW